MNNTEAILVTPKKFEIKECAVPEPKEKEILLKVEYVGMCGSDIHGFEFGPYIPHGIAGGIYLVITGIATLLLRKLENQVLAFERLDMRN